jgi:predicted tellurium resistance membrane protein TerC
VDLYQQLVALSQIIVIDFVLAGDNAIVVGMAASRVHPSMRAKVIFWGVAGAVVLRILFAAVATQLLTIVGLTLAGGICCSGCAGRCTARSPYTHRPSTRSRELQAAVCRPWFRP